MATDDENGEISFGVPSNMQYRPNKEVNVLTHDLERFLDDIEDVPERNSKYDNIFYAAIGVAGSSVYQLVSFASSGNVDWEWWAFTVALLILSVLVAAYVRGRRNGEIDQFTKWKNRCRREILHMMHKNPN